jgi:hypothetical protein
MSRMVPSPENCGRRPIGNAVAGIRQLVTNQIADHADVHGLRRRYQAQPIIHGLLDVNVVVSAYFRSTSRTRAGPKGGGPGNHAPESAQTRRRSPRWPVRGRFRGLLRSDNDLVRPPIRMNLERRSSGRPRAFASAWS